MEETCQVIIVTLLLYLKVNNTYCVWISHYNSMYVIVIFIIVSLPVITITTTGTGVIGESYSILCIIDVDDDLNNIFINNSVVKI